jgi:hypothetical protein
MHTPPRPRLWRRLLLACALGVALALTIGFFFRDWLLEYWHGADALGNRFQPGALTDYVPDDSEAVLAVNVRSLRESPLARQQLGPPLLQILRQGQRQVAWMDLLGIDPLADLDSLLFSFAPGGGKEPLWLARGRLDPSRIQIGPNKLQEIPLDGFHVWESRDRQTRESTLIAPVGDMLVASGTRGRVLAALKQASDPQPLTIRDATLRELLTKEDRRQSIWLAASCRKLGPLVGVDNFWLRSILRPLLAHAESVYGSIQCAEDLRAELDFGAASVEDAQKLETALRSVCDLAREGSWLLSRQKELLPLLRLLGTARISRQDKSIQLRSRLTAEQLEE